jgi:hypothetical protein
VSFSATAQRVPHPDLDKIWNLAPFSNNSTRHNNHLRHVEWTHLTGNTAVWPELGGCAIVASILTIAGNREPIDEAVDLVN